MSDIIGQFTADFRAKKAFDVKGVETFFDAIISETDEMLLLELFLAWNEKGIEEIEIYSIAKIMRQRVTKIAPQHEHFIDIVGTGGSKVKTFNISTAASFVVAGANVAVAKHGNRAATSKSGSSDVLSVLGVQPAVDAVTATNCLNTIGVCFMYAPNFHRLSPTLAKVRRGLGFPTIFNCVGPLCNPASAPHQLIGAWDKKIAVKMAQALALLGTKKSWIICGNDGLDEISLAAPTTVFEIEAGAVKQSEISPIDFGFEPESLRSFRIESPEQSAEIILDILSNRRNDSAAQKVVLINAAASIYLAGYADNLLTATKMAKESIAKGAAFNKLNDLILATNK